MPFCRRRCDYCAFATWTDRHHLADDYVRGCRRELAGAGRLPPGPAGADDVEPAPDRGSRADHGSVALPAATSVFFGGGTPSQLPGEGLAAILDAVHRRPGAEVTVECNPDDVDVDLLAAYRVAGVTRLSFGVQSMVPHVLASLGREHDPAAVRRAAAAAGAAGFAGAYSVDLIYGATGETLDDWRASVTQVLDLDPAPAHVSAYGLTVEPGTPLAGEPHRHPDADDQADKYELVDDLLGEGGLDWYEISNWARPGSQCAHNLLYWRQGDYRGIGCAAHSHAARPDGSARRWWNVRTPERYLRLVADGLSTEAAGEELDLAGRRSEAIALNLRTREGAAAADVDAAGLDVVAGAGLATVTGDRVVLTRRGRLLGNEVTVRLVP